MRYGWLIVGMATVTYLPRLLPLIMVTERPLPEFWKRFLFCIPYTALGALIIPGVYQAIPGEPWAAILGVGAAAICAWFRKGLIWPVLVSIGVVYLMLTF